MHSIHSPRLEIIHLGMSVTYCASFLQMQYTQVVPVEPSGCESQKKKKKAKNTKKN